MENNVTVTTSLDQMHDIIIPPAVSFWPPAPGWYALALLLLAYGIHLGLKYWSIYQNNLYRREALQELSQIDSEKEPVSQIKALLALIKRAAFQPFGREKVAVLSDDAWWDFVETHSKARIEPGLRELSQKILYMPDVQATPDEVNALAKVAKVWITTHQGEEDA